MSLDAEASDISASMRMILFHEMSSDYVESSHFELRLLEGTDNILLGHNVCDFGIFVLLIAS